MQKRWIRNIDFTLVGAIFIIIAFSLLAIASATHVTQPTGQNPYSYVEKQIINILISMVIAAALLSMHYQDLTRATRVLYIVNLLMLLAVLSPLGHSALGASRWINLGFFLLQPSEFAKLFIIITFADFLTKRQGKLNRLRDFLPCFVHIGIPMLLILKQPDLGTSLVFLAIMFAMMFIAGAKPSILIILLLGGLGLSILWVWAHLQYHIWIPLKDYQLNRLLIFMNPWKDWQGAGYNIIQSQIAIGSGGFWGKGIFNGSQNQLNFLPEQHTDFIFSVVGEELGFLGVTILLVLYFIVLYRGIRILVSSRDMFGSLLCTGIISMIGFHILINIGMTSGIMPVTGVPLPFFSYGGSSMMANMIALAILLNIYMHRAQLQF